jgi:hypothetical protein
MMVVDEEGAGQDDDAWTFEFTTENRMICARPLRIHSISLLTYDDTKNLPSRVLSRLSLKQYNIGPYSCCEWFLSVTQRRVRE